MNAERLVYMANQIGTFFTAQSRGEGKESAVAGTLDHLKKFWDPRMRDEIVAHLQAGGAGLTMPAREAVERLRDGK